MACIKAFERVSTETVDNYVYNYRVGPIPPGLEVQWLLLARLVIKNKLLKYQTVKWSS